MLVVMELDRLDIALLTALRESPRAGPLELSRRTRVARATVQARIQRLESAGVITGYGPDIDLEAAGQLLSAFVTLEIAQGALDEVAAELAAIPNILEAYMTTGAADVVCKVAAASTPTSRRRSSSSTGRRRWCARPASSCSARWCRRGCCRCSSARPSSAMPGRLPTGAVTGLAGHRGGPRLGPCRRSARSTSSVPSRCA